MALFVSTSVHKIDRKGRVSVPATFRAALEGESFNGVALIAPLSGASCIEGSGYSRVEKIAAELETMHPFSDDYDAMAMALLAGVHAASFDGEGRIVLPEELIAQAGLEGQALFAGLGAKFQIWRPDAFEETRQKALAAARAKADAMPWRPGLSASVKPGGGA